MPEFPALPIFVDAYECDTRHLTDAEHGRYLRLMFLMWMQPGCRIPNDFAWIGKRFGRTPEEAETDFRPIVQDFCRCDGKWITQKRLKKVREHAEGKRQQQSRRAKLRWIKEKEVCHGNADAASPTQCHPFQSNIDSSLRSESKGTSRKALVKKPSCSRKRAQPWPEGFTLTHDMRRFAEERVPGIDSDTEFVRFRDWAIANGRAYTDWQAAWRMRIQNPYPKAMRPHAANHFADSPILQGTARFLARQEQSESDDNVSIFTRRRSPLAH